MSRNQRFVAAMLLGLWSFKATTLRGVDVADLVITGGRVLTLDERDRVADAIAIRDAPAEPKRERSEPSIMLAQQN